MTLSFSLLNIANIELFCDLIKDRSRSFKYLCLINTIYIAFFKKWRKFLHTSTVHYLALNFFLLWHWHTTFGTWVYHHEMCVVQIHDFSMTFIFDLEVKFIVFFKTWLDVQPLTFVSFDIGIYLAHGSIDHHHEMCVAYIHLDTVLTFDLKVRYIGFWHSFMFVPQLFCPLTKLYQFDTRAMYECLTMGWCVTYIHDLWVTFTIGLKIKITFSLWICVWARSSLLSDKRISYLARGWITMKRVHL